GAGGLRPLLHLLHRADGARREPQPSAARRARRDRGAGRGGLRGGRPDGRAPRRLRPGPGAAGRPSLAGGRDRRAGRRAAPAALLDRPARGGRVAPACDGGRAERLPPPARAAAVGRRRRARPHAPPLRRGAGARAPRDDPRAPARRGHRDRPDRGLPRRGRRRLRADARLPRREPALLLPRLPVLGAQRDHRREARRARAAGDARRPRSPPAGARRPQARGVRAPLRRRRGGGAGRVDTRPRDRRAARLHAQLPARGPRRAGRAHGPARARAARRPPGRPGAGPRRRGMPPDASEGELSKIRASLVNADVLARKARELDVGSALRFGKGEEKSGGREKVSILASAYEALLGAVYADGGYEAARAMVEHHFAGDIEEHLTVGLRDYKTRLQELTQRLFRETPLYTLVEESGPDHAKRFVSEIALGGRCYGRGLGRTKKAAEQAAAGEALAALEREHADRLP